MIWSLTYLHRNSVWPEPEVGLATDDGLGLRVVQMRVEDLLWQGQGPTKLSFNHIKGLKVIHECVKSADNEFSLHFCFHIEESVGQPDVRENDGLDYLSIF